MALRAIKWSDGKLEILDQLLLPKETVFIEIKSVKDGWNAINKMQVRGAPAIAVAGCLSLAVDIIRHHYNNTKVLLQDIKDKLDYLITARPTAVNIKLAADEIIQFATKLSKEDIYPDDMKDRVITEIISMLEKDIEDNISIGIHGSTEILQRTVDEKVISVITHCNTGSLATVGYGTALGVIRALHKTKKIEQIYCTETRPYNQGARLTTYELVHDKIPCTLICDSMVASLMKSKNIAAVIVGADRVAANGDTANKIGTYQIAVLARYHEIPFYVAAPLTTIDFSIPNGDSIKIEERPHDELTCINGVRIAAEGINVWNPAFDITPAKIITGVITNKGVYRPHDLVKLKQVKD
ncbi:methylthioribose-1-phosphate isomerase [Phymastichus coffea]|uniref:methylthioribose-1-phosphate isomerase n=1 Tax=Phymastichus coffea TaxID=108790 RepID=UPI00273AD72D|nr:methylthioribose-1-phosphate isomerase [Phymastichus coffea]